MPKQHSNQSPERGLPTHAEIIVIGGGIIGCSTAYHLAKEGAKDVLLLEGGQLTNGSTWHAAGLVGQLRSSANITKILQRSVQLYQTLKEETGLDTGWRMNGGLRLACNQDRWIEVKRQATTAHSFGLPMELLTAKEAQDLWPLMDVSDVVGAAFLPTDGQANPADITQSLAKGARKRGVVIKEHCLVTDFIKKDGNICAVVTEHGTIQCEKLVICCGQWTKQLAKLAGVNVPLQSVEHQYMVTEALTPHAVPSTLPTLRDPDRLIYFKEEVGGLVMGGYEPNPIVWAKEKVPENFYYSLLDSNWSHFEPLMEQALFRVPALQTAGITTLTNGPESFTPDGNFILGESPEVGNLFIGSGFNAFGIASGGGAGEVLAQWVLANEQPFDCWPVDIRRFGHVHENKNFVINRTLEAYSKHYTMSWPHEEYQSERGYFKSPLYGILKSQGACFGSKLGWERPNWFATNNEVAQDCYAYGRQNWFATVGREHLAVRERVGVFDQTSFAKFKLIGKDALSTLSWLCANNVDKAVGRLTYTQMLNNQGGIECDLTVGRIAEDTFYLVTGTGFRTHDSHWVKSNIPKNSEVIFEDVTDQLVVLSIMGPKSRHVLGELSDTQLDNDSFPFASIKNIRIKDIEVMALRITYVGELGWELHFPKQHAKLIYEAIMEAGQEYGIVNAGYRAIESLRLEKGYLAWGADITPDHSPFDAGLEWAVKLKSMNDFKGKAALTKISQQRRFKKLICLSVEDVNVVLLGRESIFRNGQLVGYLSSAGWGYTVNRNIGYGYIKTDTEIDNHYLQSGEYTLEVACEKVKCRLESQPMYDAKMLKIYDDELS